MTIEMVRFDQRVWFDDEMDFGDAMGLDHDDADDEIVAWDDLDDAEWTPADLTAVLDEFADRYLPGGRDAHPGLDSPVASLRMWRTVSPDVDLGRQVGFEAAEVLATYPDVHPSDVVMLCDRHRDGLEAVKVLEACGYPAVHSFASRRRDRDPARRAMRWDGPGVKACRTDQFDAARTAAPVKVVVIGVGAKKSSARWFHRALSTLSVSSDAHPVLVAVVNADPALAGFAEVFDAGLPDERQVERADAPATWAPPDPSTLVDPA